MNDTPITPFLARWMRYGPVLLLVAVLLLGYVLLPVLTPFLIAAVLAYVLRPITEKLIAWRIPPALAVLGTLALLGFMLVLFLLVVIPIAVDQFQNLRQALPGLLDYLGRTPFAPYLKLFEEFWKTHNADSLRTLLENNGLDVWTKNFLREQGAGFGAVFFRWAGFAVLIPVILFYFLLDWPTIQTRLEACVPQRTHAGLRALESEINQMLSQYLRGQLLVMIVMASFYSIGLSFTGLHSALPIGLLAGFLVFIPYLGVILGLLLAILVAALQFQNWGGILPIALVFVLGHTLESLWITPRWVGQRIGLHPVAVLFALMALGWLLGIVGVFLAMPLSALLVVAARRLWRYYVESDWYQQN